MKNRPMDWDFTQDTNNLELNITQR
jgi:hypothetical protein